MTAPYGGPPQYGEPYQNPSGPSFDKPGASRDQTGQYGQGQYGDNQYGQGQHGNNQYGQGQYGDNQYGQQGYPSAPYGQPSPYGPNPYAFPNNSYPPPPPSNGIGVAGFVCALVGLVLFWFPFLGLALAVVGTVLSGFGMSNGRKSGASTGLAVAGLVCGIIALIPGILWLVLIGSV